MVTATLSYALPSALETKLRQIRRRQTILSTVRAVAIGASALIMAMLAAMIIDWWFTLFDPGVRTALTVLSLIAVAAALLATGIPALVEAWRYSRAAVSADQEVPQLEERWTTVTLISKANHQPATPTARAMLQQVTSEAVAMQKLVQPSRVARPAALRPAGMLLAACCAVLAGFLALNWPQTSVLLRRFWSPRTEITATQLASLKGNLTIPRGESLDLTTQLSGLPRRTALLELATGEEIVDVLTLRPDQERKDAFVHRLKVDQSFRYRVSSGDGRTPWHTVTAIDYPALGEVHLTVTPPDYVDRPTYEKTLIPNRVKVIQGSRLQLHLKPQRPLARMELALTYEPAGAEEKPLQRLLTLTPDAGGWYRYETQLLVDMSLRPTLFSEHGLTNEHPHLCRIQVVPDKAPLARITSPTDEMVVAPDNVIEIKFEAHDDHGIAAAELLIYDETDTEKGEEPKLLSVQPIPLDQQQLKQHVLASTQLDLNKLGLREGTSISYAIRVTDNRQVKLDPEALRSQMAEANAGQDGEESQASDRKKTDSEALENMLADSRKASGELTDKAGPDSQVPATPAEPSAAEEKDEPTSGNGSERSPNASQKTASDRPTSAGDSKNSAEQKGSDDTKLKSRNAPVDGAPPPDPQNGDLPPAVAAAEMPAPEQNTGEGKGANRDAQAAPRPDRQLAMTAQQSESGQNAETSRRKLKIAERLTAVAAASDRRSETMAIRERVLEIDKMLAEAEAGAQKLVQRDVPDAQRSELFRRLDVQLGEVEDEISGLRNETKDHQFAFVGLQMVDIGRSHVTSARERAFIGIREPLGSDNASVALQQIVRARELLAALLKRYDRAARDRELAKGLEEAVKMYEVYVEKTHRLMREARQNMNPLKRKMAVIEVDQEYLDRFAEVLTLRREMMAELARLLGDDPRLLARYLDLTKRRRSSLRDQLSELADRQDDLATEVLGWLEVGETQKDVLWQVVAELRLQAAAPLAKDAAETAESIEKQMPLVLENDRGTSALVIKYAQQIAGLARQISFDARGFAAQAGEQSKPVNLTGSAEQLVYLCGELEAGLDQLNFEREDEEEVTSYCTSRLLELRSLADQAEAWAQIAGHLRHKHYPGLAQIDQQKLAIAAELLRVEMLGIEEDLSGEFQQQAETGVPAEILEMVRELQAVMEGITFNQAAATFCLSQSRVEAAAVRQSRAVEEFERAKKLFDKIRRAVVAALDEYDQPNPNIADLRDPTLDEFLAQLEREPNIEAQLGIPNRPRNLRVIADTMTWQQNGGDMLGQSSDAALARAQQIMREKEARAKPPEKPDSELTEEERSQREKQRQQQETLEKSLASIQKKADDPMTPPEQRRQLQQMAENVQRMLTQMGQRTADAEEWERIVESDKARGILKALARGEGLPDEQWNKLLSTLDDGLWQVRGRKPPEDYRKAIEQYQEYLRQLDSGGE